MDTKDYRGYFLILLYLILLLSVPLNVSANNGGVLNSPFVNSGAPTRYANGKYYDVAVPYNTKVMDIGGMATGGSSTGKYKVNAFTDSNLKQNCCFMRQNDGYGSTKDTDVNGNLTKGNDSVTGLNYYEVDGIKYYLGSLGQGCYAYSGWDAYNENGKWSASDLLSKGTPAKSGLLFDLILKDGTQIHFAASDFIGYDHSVGGSSNGQDGITYTRSTLKYPQYKAMWHCQSSAHMVEYFGTKSPSETRTALGISDSNPVLYIRIWNMSLHKGDIVCNLGKTGYKTSGTALSTSGGGLDITGNGGVEQSGSGVNAEGTGDGSTPTSQGDGQPTQETVVNSPQFMQGAYSESQLSSFSTLCEVPLELATDDSLTVGQNYTLQNWKDTVDSNLEETILVVWMRRIVTIIGILFTVWMLFLYLSYWFDRVNVFFEFSMLSTLSFGRLRVSPDEYECTWQLSELVRSKQSGTMTVNHRAMLEIVIIGCLFGSLIISGTMFKIVRLVIFFILRVLGII